MASNPATLGKSGKFGDLKRRLLLLLGVLVVYRIGAHMPVPGIDPVALAQLFQGQKGGKVRRQQPVEEYLKLQKRYALLFGKTAAVATIARLQAAADKNIRKYGLLDQEAN